MATAFFGHRHFNGAKYHDILFNMVLTLVDKHHEDKFLFGGYGQFDAFAAQTVYEVKKIRPHVKMTLVLPYCPGKIENFTLWEGYDDCIYPPIEEGPIKFAITRRNRWMVKNSDMIIAGVNCSYGGAYDAIKYAQRAHTLVVNLCDLIKEPTT